MLSRNMPVVSCDHKGVPAVDAEQFVWVLPASLLALPAVRVMGSSGAGPPVAAWAEETVTEVSGSWIGLATNAPPHVQLLQFDVKKITNIKDRLNHESESYRT